MALRQSCERKVELTRVGGIYVSLIDPVSGYARKQDGAPPGPPPPPAAAPFDSPFGQFASLRGNVPDVNCVDVNLYEYRIETRDLAGGGPWTGLVTPTGWQVIVGLFCPIFSWTPYSSDGDGWIRLADYWQAKACAPDHALNVWGTSGKNGLHEVRLVLRRIGLPGSEVVSSEVRVLLDNIAPDPVQLSLFDATGTVLLGNQCKVEGAAGPTILAIKGQVRDRHFRAYSLTWTGGLNNSWNTVDLVPPETSDYRFYDSARVELGDNGTEPPAATDVPLGTFNLTAEHMAVTGGQPPGECGYTVRLRACDRTIRGSFSTLQRQQNIVGDYAQLGWCRPFLRSFCFKPAEADE